MRFILFHKINNISRIKHRNSSIFDIITQQRFFRPSTAFKSPMSCETKLVFEMINSSTSSSESELTGSFPQPII